MNHTGLRTLVLAATLVTSGLAAAASQNVCVPQAIGVPSRGGPPTWLNWTGSSGLVQNELDDPRWLGANGHSLGLGSARAPLLSRMLWTTFGSTKYLLMSFVVDLEAITGAGLTSPRDIFLGFRRPSALGTGTPDRGDDEYGYIFQFHLNGDSASGTDLVAPTHCSSFASCAELPGPGKNFWRMFVDRDMPGSCTVGTATTNGPSFLAFTGGGPDGALITWMTNPASPEQDSVRYWKLDSDEPLLQHRWAVQVRIKIAEHDTDPIELGIPPSSTFWYEGTSQLATAGGDYGAIGWWPRELTESVCVNAAAPNQLVHPQLGDPVSCVGSSSSACSVNNYRPLKLYSGTRPSDCESGLFIDTPYIGSFVATAATDLTRDWPTTSFKANATNTVVAQVTNLGDADVDVPLLARFRLAQWGTAPWNDPTQHGIWQDIPAARNGKCGTGTPPTCAPPPLFTVPRFVDGDMDGLADVRAPIKFEWTLGTDATLGASEFCKYGLKPPDVGATVGACTTCTCAAGDPECDSAMGKQANVAAAGVARPCVSTRIEHQCMFVELSAPGGAADFAQQSSWNNMNFDQLSTVSREALIDARQLPTRPGQTEQDIVLIAMARNMPATLAAGPADGGTFVRERALVRAETLAAPYLADLARMTPQVAEAIARQVARPAAPELAALIRDAGQAAPAARAASTGGDKLFRERVQRVARALQIMPAKDQKLVTSLLVLVLGTQSAAELNEAIVHSVGPTEAAGIVPTLEIYPFYKRFGRGPAYTPMTAFTVFLGHDGAMSGIDWRIDGADKVGQNLYHLRIPVGFARRIQVRAQAIQPPEAVLGPSQPKWPCTSGGGCVACGGAASRNCGLVSMVGNGLPAIFAGVLVVRRRRKKPGPARPAA